MGQLTLTTQEVQNILEGRLHSFIQDIHDTEHTIGSPQVVVADTPIRYTNNGGIPIKVVSPTYFTDRWNATDDKMAFITEENTPTYVAEVGFIFDPTVAAAGVITLRTYIDDATTPKLIGTYNGAYKAIAEPHSLISTFYLGDDAGYDLKNDGIYFELEFEGAGNLYGKTLKLYRT